MDTQTITVSPARFDATKIAVNKKSTLDSSDLAKIADVEKSNQKGAIWIHIREDQIFHLELVTTHLKYKFHRYDDGSKEYVYYKWNNPNQHDKVPAFATSIGGAAALILSKDSSKVFLVFEYGKFKCVTGSVDRGELSMTTAIREVGEEVSIKLDTDFTPKVCGLWNIASARPCNINDTLVCYIVKAASDEFKLDTFEVSDGRWFDISFLIQAYYSLPQDKGKLTSDLTSDFIEYQGVKLSICAIIWLCNYFKGRTLDVFTSQNGKTNFVY